MRQMLQSRSQLEVGFKLILVNFSQIIIMCHYNGIFMKKLEDEDLAENIALLSHNLKGIQEKIILMCHYNQILL